MYYLFAAYEVNQVAN